MPKPSVLINGCSFSRGPISWPYYLSSVDQDRLVNLAMASAGNTYIHESTVWELSQRKYDLVLIMWSGICRVDFKVDDIDAFSNYKCTSNYQLTKNDWPTKKVIPVNDQDYVDLNWVFAAKFGQQIKNTEIYKHVGIEQMAYHFLIKLISLQNTLKILDIPYCFFFGFPDKDDLIANTNLCKLVDWDNIYIEENIWDIAKKTNDFDETRHPGINTNKTWAKMVDSIVEQKLLKESNCNA
jgi:hypothetical protein